ncbi:hypothetical protein ACH5RR_032630 [Cinchona calisaya]|uniref:Uncharacterized protein n=1 Tax=Cinchona calisaya TaxID=153742 RepID=A0ABD2YJR9_9GENT
MLLSDSVLLNFYAKDVLFFYWGRMKKEFGKLVEAIGSSRWSRSEGQCASKANLVAAAVVRISMKKKGIYHTEKQDSFEDQQLSGISKRLWGRFASGIRYPDERLLDPLKLEMFVDKLQDMPKIKDGFRNGDKVHVTKELQRDYDPTPGGKEFPAQCHHCHTTRTRFSILI